MNKSNLTNIVRKLVQNFKSGINQPYALPKKLVNLPPNSL